MAKKTLVCKSVKHHASSVKASDLFKEGKRYKVNINRVLGAVAGTVTDKPAIHGHSTAIRPRAAGITAQWLSFSNNWIFNCVGCNIVGVNSPILRRVFCTITVNS